MQESAILCRRPSPRLHRAAQLQRQFIRYSSSHWFSGILAFAHQAPEIAVRADVVEAMIMHSKMADVGSHSLYRRRTPQIAELLFRR